MLGFIISTLVFSAMVWLLNSRSGLHPDHQTVSIKTRIMLIATISSICAGWGVDKVDGDADQPHPSLAQAIHSGNATLIAKAIIGIN